MQSYQRRNLSCGTRRNIRRSSDRRREKEVDHVEIRPAEEEGAFAFDVAKHVQCRRDATRGSISYVKHSIEDGNLENILYANDEHCDISSNESLPSTTASTEPPFSRPPLLVTSLHSCGNLLHHGLSSITLNPSVRAVAMTGCCYNLMTERLGPATYKHPQLRPYHPRLEATGNACDPHGFPMSRRLEEYSYPALRSLESSIDSPSKPNIETGVRLNITARMMAVQAPHNWGPKDCADFFTRHFYRALLQRILLDLGVITQDSTTPLDSGDTTTGLATSLSTNGQGSEPPNGTPTDTRKLPTLILGSLPKSAFLSFPSYVRAALTKLTNPSTSTLSQPQITHLLARAGPDILTSSLIDDYEIRFAGDKEKLSIMWSLMAFSAGVVESLIVVDRWLWLREQECVDQGKCWVESVFEYGRSPRNLVVVGVKKAGW